MTKKSSLSVTNKTIIKLPDYNKQSRIPNRLKDKIKIIDTWEESDVAVSELFEKTEIFQNEKNRIHA